MNRTSAPRTDSGGTPRPWELLRCGRMKQPRPHHRLMTPCRRVSRWGWTSVARNGNSTRCNRAWCCCSIPDQNGEGVLSVELQKGPIMTTWD